jgi:hypothetical protein
VTILHVRFAAFRKQGSHFLLGRQGGTLGAYVAA